MGENTTLKVLIAACGETLRMERDTLKISLLSSVAESSEKSTVFKWQHSDNREADDSLQTSAIARQVFPLCARFCAHPLSLHSVLLH